jgi:hypothetical protein
MPALGDYALEILLHLVHTSAQTSRSAREMSLPVARNISSDHS